MARSAVKLSHRPTQMAVATRHKSLIKSSRSTLHPGKGRSSWGFTWRPRELLEADGCWGREGRFFQLCSHWKVLPMLLIVLTQAALVNSAGRNTLTQQQNTKQDRLVGKKGSVEEGCELARYIIYMHSFVKNVSIMYFINI